MKTEVELEELPPKVAKFVKAKVEGKSNVEAGLIAGAPTPGAASMYANRTLKNVDIQIVLAKQLKKHGIDVKRILGVINDAMNATKTVVHGKDSDEAWVDEVPDHNTRLKAAAMAQKLMGLEQKQVGVNSYGPTFVAMQQPNRKELVEAIESGDEVEIKDKIFPKA
jgi:hypothetical protein